MRALGALRAWRSSTSLPGARRTRAISAWSPIPIGPMNLANIHDVTRSTPTIVCGWGQDPAVTIWGQGGRVVSDSSALGRTLSALKLTLTARPRIRSISRGDLKPIPFPA